MHTHTQTHTHTVMITKHLWTVVCRRSKEYPLLARVSMNEGTDRLSTTGVYRGPREHTHRASISTIHHVLPMSTQMNCRQSLNWTVQTLAHRVSLGVPM